MNAAMLELALKKQRLQIAGESLRTDFERYAAGLAPAFTGANRAIAVSQWVHRHPQFFVAAGIAFAIARPKRAWRWTRRAFVAWRAWRKLHGFLQHRLPA